MSRQGSHFQAALFGNKMVLSGGKPGISLSRVESIDLANWSSVLDCNLSALDPNFSIRGESLNTVAIGDRVYFGSHESISVYSSTTKAWKYAKVETHTGLLFAYLGQLYSFRYEQASMQHQVIKINL